MNILVAGCAGFIGSHFVDLLVSKRRLGDYIVGYDRLTYAGLLSNVNQSIDEFISGDICNSTLLQYVCTKNKIDWIVNFAAETHVDNSIKGCNEFVDTNVKGVLSILDACRLFDIKYLHVSTDEVYGPADIGISFIESDRFAPMNPYAATKAAAEHLVQSYINTHNVAAKIVRPCNNFGPRQHDEKFIPTIINAIKAQQAVPVYGDGNQIRDWLFVRDCAAMIYDVFMRGQFSAAYNLTVKNELTNNELVSMLHGFMNVEYNKNIKYVNDRPGHDRRYSIDNALFNTHMGFYTCVPFNAALHETVAYYAS